MALDRNTLLSLNKDPKSIDLHNLALAKMKNVRVDNTARHSFIKDRQRSKNIKNIDELYEKLNEMERNGVMDIWINKFGKKKYQGGQVGGVESTAKNIKQSLRESIEISQDFHIEEGILVIDKQSIIDSLREQYLAEASLAEESMGSPTGSGVPIAPMTPSTGKPELSIIDRSPVSETHQDTEITERKNKG